MIPLRLAIVPPESDADAREDQVSCPKSNSNGIYGYGVVSSHAKRNQLWT